MTIHDNKSPIRLSEIAAEFNHNNLSTKKGQTWYLDGVLTTGTFATAQLRYSDFYLKRATDPAAAGSYDAPVGSTTFTVPLYRNNLNVKVWGGGGRGGNFGRPGQYAADGHYEPNGGDSSFGSVIGGGGGGGQNAGTGTAGGNYYGAGGAGGVASGGDINLAGAAGGGGGGNGGNAGDSGGAGGVNPGGRCQYADGTYPGGGGSGSNYNFNGKFPAYCGGGGGGGYAEKNFPAGTLPAGTQIPVVVGAGAPQDGYYPSFAASTSGNGADGRVLITWN